VKPVTSYARRRTIQALLCGFASVTLSLCSAGQSIPQERTFTQSKAVVEKALKELQPSTAGRLPVLDGFAIPGQRPLDRMQRGYYQCTVQVSSTQSGGSLVRVSAKITAWYADPDSSKSGYLVLPSNGRLESDLLDRLAEALGASPPPAATPANPVAAKPKTKTDLPAPTISAPQPSDTVRGERIGASKSSVTASSPFKMTPPATADPSASLATRRAVTDRHVEELTKEAKNLEEILRNQAHPNNLAAVKKSGTPVLSNPSEGAKVLFLAAAEDEFEILDMNTSWVHVRISGLSRGWIRRSGVEMPDEPGKAAASEAPQQLTPPKTESVGSANRPAFQVENEQIASFPGAWEPLRGKTVKIITAQKVNEKAGDTSSRGKLQFAKSLFDRAYVELTQSYSTAAGVVVIFDSEDGGMMATTLPVLQQWKAGTLSDEALWRRCFFDPPEMFDSSASR
jgi:hypothetical protein